jgi:hypothetical protein
MESDSCTRGLVYPLAWPPSCASLYLISIPDAATPLDASFLSLYGEPFRGALEHPFVEPVVRVWPLYHR